MKPLGLMHFDSKHKHKHKHKKNKKNMCEPGLHKHKKMEKVPFLNMLMLVFMHIGNPASHIFFLFLLCLCLCLCLCESVNQPLAMT